MESLVITWRELLIIVAVVLAVYVAEMLLLLRSKRGGRRWKSDAASAEPRLDALESEIEQVHAQLLHFKEQLDKLEAAPPPQANAPSSSPYSQAIQLAKQGADVSEVAANCGISRGEAELIVAMHRAKGL
ncbi:hypothetical protein SKTS_21640 [Sulfurimicrobium lacus]|uniref:DUF2802 domain-containing protein n=1 Tax=Sulfurimicrobium lacus TaxID=2715678 RepID=A0A6F8VC30_9PROT|nr:DUF2802 domain-containing protein [Sulfurimicrobium lacus]BCB27278.1 hypothetical protein SKTS_21640 [Sulfurimicrobium lacus]